MATKIFCTDINALDEFTMIQNGREILQFSVFYSDGTPVDLTSIQSIYWVLCRYGNPNYSVLKKEAQEIFENNFQIILDPQDTTYLSGKYIQQPVIVDFYGVEHRFSQGIINFIPGILYNN